VREISHCIICMSGCIGWPSKIRIEHVDAVWLLTGSGKYLVLNCFPCPPPSNLTNSKCMKYFESCSLLDILFSLSIIFILRRKQDGQLPIVRAVR